MSDSAWTPRTIHQVETEERGSRFLASAVPLGASDDVKALIAEEKDQHPKASHVAYAWRLSDSATGSISEGFSDDGEPGGTAGMPMLKVLQHECATNLLIMVTRYFGGTKLGTGGLQRAYGGACSAVIKSISNESRKPWVRLQRCSIEGDYQHEGDIRALIADSGGMVFDTCYSEAGVEIHADLPNKHITEIRNNLPHFLRLNLH